jgi:hypothetical protein
MTEALISFRVVDEIIGTTSSPMAFASYLDVPAANFFVVKSNPRNKRRNSVDQAGSWRASVAESCSLEILRKPKSVNRLSELASPQPRIRVLAWPGVHRSTFDQEEALSAEFLG